MRGVLAAPALLLVVGVARVPVLFVVGVAGAAALGVAGLRRGSQALPDRVWRGLAPAPAAVAPPTAVVPTGFVPRPAQGSPVRALAAVESRELLVSPALGVGAGMSALLIVLLGWMGAREALGRWDGAWEDFYGAVVFAAHPLLGFIAMGTHFAVTRSRRQGCDELMDSCPLDRQRRLAGHLGTAVTGVGLVLLFAGLFTAAVVTGADTQYGPRAAALAPTLLGLAVLGAGAVAVGVATGRWAPWGVSPVLALIGIAAVGSWATSPERWTPRRFLATAETGHPADLLFLEPRAWARLAWLSSMAAAIALAALAGGSRRARGALAVAAVAAAVSAAAVVRPMSDHKAAAAAELVASPAAHQHCVDATGVPVCAYHRYAEAAERMAAAARPVAAAAPAHSLDGVRFMQFPSKPSALPAAVLRALDGRPPAIPAGAHDLGYRTSRAEQAALRLRVAALAVGAPAEPTVKGPDEDEPTGAVGLAGQARGVVLLWLASRGLPLDEALDLAPDVHVDLTARPDVGGATQAGMSWPTDCGRGGSVTWSRQDFAAARAVMRADAAEVGRVVTSRWREFVDPATRTDTLLAALGLAPVGPPDPGIEPAAYSC